MANPSTTTDPAPAGVALAAPLPAHSRRGALLIPDDLDDRPEVIALLDGPDGGRAVAAWTLGLLWMHRAARPRPGVPAGRLHEILATVAIAQALVRVGLWQQQGDVYVPATHDAAGRRLWKRESSPTGRPSRPAIPREVRAAVYERDRYRCLDCGAVDDLTLDHIYPWSLGGPDTVDNLRALCRPCNSRKGARVL